MVIITGTPDEGNVSIITSEGIAVMSEKLQRGKMVELYRTLGDILIVQNVGIAMSPPSQTSLGATGDPEPAACEPKKMGKREYGPKVTNWLKDYSYKPYILSDLDFINIANMVNDGRKIQAIKDVRTPTDLGLKRAKDLVEAIYDDWYDDDDFRL